MQESFRIHGGYGYSKEYEIERLMREAPFLLIGEGTSEIQKTIISRGLLKEYAALTPAGWASARSSAAGLVSAGQALDRPHDGDAAVLDVVEPGLGGDAAALRRRDALLEPDRARAPTATAWRTTSVAWSDGRNTFTRSTGSGTSASVGIAALTPDLVGDTG